MSTFEPLTTETAAATLLWLAHVEASPPVGYGGQRLAWLAARAEQLGPEGLRLKYQEFCANAVENAIEVLATRDDDEYVQAQIIAAPVLAEA